MWKFQEFLFPLNMGGEGGGETALLGKQRSYSHFNVDLLFEKEILAGGEQTW